MEEEETATFKAEKSSILQIFALFYVPQETGLGKRRIELDETFTVFHVTDNLSTELQEVGRSKIFATPARLQFQVSYFFGRKQKLVIKLYGSHKVAGGVGNKRKTSLVATCEVFLGELIRSGLQWKDAEWVTVEEFWAEAPNFALKLKGIEPDSEKEQSNFRCRAQLSTIPQTLVRSLKLFYTISRKNEDLNCFEELGRSEVVKGTAEPQWPPVTVFTRQFYDNISGKTSWLKVTVVKVSSWPDQFGPGRNKTENMDIIAESELLDGSMLRQFIGVGLSFSLRDPRSERSNGKLDLNIVTTNPPTFIDHLHNGMQLNFAVAIDYSYNNGAVDDPACYHRIKDHGTNDYMEAIRAVGDIIKDYDTDKKFPVFGFGAELENGNISYDFNCTLSDDELLVDGVEGILRAYRTVQAKIKMKGTAQIAPIIRTAARLAEATKNHGGGHYFVLMILTTGNIADLDEATRAVIQVAHSPISVIIVGIGNNDFKKLDDMGAKGKLLNIDGNYCPRDVVSFVPYKNQCGFSEDEKKFCSKEFAADVMYEIPDQVLAYMGIRNPRVSNQLETSPQGDEDQGQIPVTETMIGETAKNTELFFFNRKKKKSPARGRPDQPGNVKQKKKYRGDPNFLML